MKTFRLALLGSVVAGVGAMAAVDASAADVEKSVKMYGWVNRMVGVQDDGNSTSVNHLDNDLESSRVGIDAAAKSPNLTIGAKFEWSFEAGSNNDAATSQTNNTNASRGVQDIRHSDIYFATQYGKLSMGHGSSAAKDAANSDLSGTTVAMSVGEPLSRGMGFSADILDAAGVSQGTVGGAASNTSAAIQVADVMLRADGARRNRIRYDTPRFAGFGAAVSHGQADVSEYRLDYAGELFDTKLAAAVAAQTASASTTQFERMYISSISAKHKSGVNLTYSYAVQNQNGSTSTGAIGVAGTGTGSNTDGRRPATHYSKIGYSRDFFGIGDTNLAIDHQITFDGSRGGDRAVKWGGGVVQNLSAYGTELYATYENVSYTRGSTRTLATPSVTNVNGYNEINAGYFGARVKF